jgi:hypothetical protein
VKRALLAGLLAVLAVEAHALTGGQLVPGPVSITQGQIAPGSVGNAQLALDALSLYKVSGGSLTASGQSITLIGNPSAFLILNRLNTAAYSKFQHQTGGVTNWSVGPASDATEDYQIFNDVDGATRFIIKSGTGRVGISTKTPGAALDVNGDEIVRGNTFSVGATTLTVSGGNIGFGVAAPNYSPAQAWFKTKTNRFGSQADQGNHDNSVVAVGANSITLPDITGKPFPYGDRGERQFNVRHRGRANRCSPTIALRPRPDQRRKYVGNAISRSGD